MWTAVDWYVSLEARAIDHLPVSTRREGLFEESVASTNLERLSAICPAGTRVMQGWFA